MVRIMIGAKAEPVMVDAMTPEGRSAFQRKEYAEALRYMENAEGYLQKAKRDGPLYVDVKYVRTACGTAYNGLLIALDAWLALKGVLPPNTKERNPSRKPDGKPVRKNWKSIEYYKYNLAKLDQKMLAHLDTAYHVLHLCGYYDGIKDVKAISSGFDNAYRILEKIKPAAA